MSALTPSGQPCKSTDYYFLFQASGVNFLMSDLCLRFYTHLDAVALSRDNQYQYYIHTKEFPRAKEFYAEFYASAATVLHSCERFEEARGELVAFFKRLKELPTVGTEEFEQSVSLASAMLNEYGKFDHLYTDSLFKEEQVDHELVALVAEKKNVLREEINEIFFNTDGGLAAFVDVLARQYGVSAGELLYSPVEDIRALLRGKGVLSAKQDPTTYAAVREGSTFRNYFDGAARDFVSAFLVEKDTSGDSEVRGTSVSKRGIYTGEVRKITVDYADLQRSVAVFDSIPAGIVLVTESTVPEMLPLMSRALAIVTDMGGMLSHAAITSRELGIPCVIGTKKGTEVLHDGDVVELDADTGTIKIVERAS